MVVNIIGLVFCAVKEQFYTHPIADVDYFHSITIEANKMLMFRLAESQIEVLVHELAAEI